MEELITDILEREIRKKTDEYYRAESSDERVRLAFEKLDLCEAYVMAYDTKEICDMYAIMNKRTKKYVRGTDWSKKWPTQQTSDRYMLTYPTAAAAQRDIFKRECGKNYVVVRIAFSKKDLYDEDKKMIEKIINQHTV